MKRIILSVIIMAFAVAVQADDAKTGQDKEKSACCASKVKTSAETKGGCPFAKSACCKQAPVKQTVLLSPKASDAKQ
jgi:hypothetical protein